MTGCPDHHCFSRPCQMTTDSKTLVLEVCLFFPAASPALIGILPRLQDFAFLVSLDISHTNITMGKQQTKHTIYPNLTFFPFTVYLIKTKPNQKSLKRTSSTWRILSASYKATTVMTEAAVRNWNQVTKGCKILLPVNLSYTSFATLLQHTKSKQDACVLQAFYSRQVVTNYTKPALISNPFCQLGLYYCWFWSKAVILRVFKGR